MNKIMNIIKSEAVVSAAKTLGKAILTATLATLGITWFSGCSALTPSTKSQSMTVTCAAESHGLSEGHPEAKPSREAVARGRAGVPSDHYRHHDEPGSHEQRRRRGREHPDHDGRRQARCGRIHRSDDVRWVTGVLVESRVTTRCTSVGRALRVRRSREPYGAQRFPITPSSEL